MELLVNNGIAVDIRPEHTFSPACPIFFISHITYAPICLFTSNQFSWVAPIMFSSIIVVGYPIALGAFTATFILVRSTRTTLVSGRRSSAFCDAIRTLPLYSLSFLQTHCASNPHGAPHPWWGSEVEPEPRTRPMASPPHQGTPYAC